MPLQGPTPPTEPGQDCHKVVIMGCANDDRQWLLRAASPTLGWRVPQGRIVHPAANCPDVGCGGFSLRRLVVVFRAVAAIVACFAVWHHDSASMEEFASVLLVALP